MSTTTTTPALNTSTPLDSLSMTFRGLEASIHLDFGVNTTGASGILFDEDANTVAETEMLRYSGFCTRCVIYKETQRLIDWRRGIEPGDIHDLLDMLGFECHCDDDDEDDDCQGHPAGPFDPMGVTTYCDGSCR